MQFNGRRKGGGQGSGLTGSKEGGDVLWIICQMGQT